MVLTSQPFPLDDHAAPGGELLDLPLNRQMLGYREMLLGQCAAV
jgi:hypothetical protein